MKVYSLNQVSQQPWPTKGWLKTGVGWNVGVENLPTHHCYQVWTVENCVSTPTMKTWFVAPHKAFYAAFNKEALCAVKKKEFNQVYSL